MKKFSILFLFFLLSILPILSIAELDLKSMSYEELLSLRSSILNEMVGRNEFVSADVPAGDYVVGEDIPAGIYSLSLSKGSLMSMIMVNGTRTVHSVGEDTPVGKIELSNGDDVSISYGSITFETYSGLSFK